MERVNQPHFQKIKKAIQNANHADIFQASTIILQNSPDDIEAKLCYIVSALKTQNFKQLHNTVFKLPPTTKDPQDIQLFYAYSFYLQNDYGKAIKYLGQLKKQSNRIKILLSQLYYKSLNYELSTQLLLEVVNSDRKSQSIVQYLVNLLGFGQLGATHNGQITKISQQITKKLENLPRDLLFNLVLFNQTQNNIQKSRSFLKQYISLLTDPKEDYEDILASKLIQDHQQFSNLQAIQNKIKEYEKYENIQVRDKNLKVVIQNNLLALKQLVSLETHHQQIKKFDDFINGKYKQTRTQLLLLKLNKLILQLQKNRYHQANKTLKDLQTSFTLVQLNYTNTFTKCKVYLYIKLKQEKQLQLLFAKFPINDVFLNFYLRIQSLRGISKQPIPQIFKQYKMFGKSNPILISNQVINRYIFSVILKDQQLFQTELDSLNQMIATTNDIRMLKILKQVFNKKGQIQKQTIILQKILKINPKDPLAKLNLAKIKLANGQLQIAQELMKGLQKPDQITDMDYLQTLQNNIHISVAKQDKVATLVPTVETTIKLRKRIKKNRKRFPKSFDPKNPGPPPNPERWLPKYERKDFKKKKNFKSGRTQGATNVGKQSVNTYTNANTTSNIDVVKGKAKKSKK